MSDDDRETIVIHEAPEPQSPMTLEPPDPTGRRRLLWILLGLLLIFLLAGIIFLGWFGLVGGDGDGDDANAATGTDSSVTTAETTAPVTPPPAVATTPTVAASPTAVPTATPVPGAIDLGNCTGDEAPDLALSYAVTGVDTKLNQRSAPSIDGDIVGEFGPGASGIMVSGGCINNPADGYVWWEIADTDPAAWVASDFLTPQG